jgi:hypothetical protein
MRDTSIIELDAEEIEQVSGGANVALINAQLAQGALDVAKDTKDSQRTFTAQSNISRKWSQTMDGIVQNLK